MIQLQPLSASNQERSSLTGNLVGDTPGCASEGRSTNRRPAADSETALWLSSRPSHLQAWDQSCPQVPARWTVRVLHAPRRKHTHVRTWMYTDTSHVISSKTLASYNLNHKTATLYTISHWEDWTSSFIFLSNHCHIQMDTKSKLCLRMSLEIYFFPIFSATAFQFKPASSLPRPVAIVWFFFHLNFLYH